MSLVDIIDDIIMFSIVLCCIFIAITFIIATIHLFKSNQIIMGFIISIVGIASILCGVSALE